MEWVVCHTDNEVERTISLLQGELRLGTSLNLKTSDNITNLHER